MAGKAINEYNAFTGNPDAVNILVQEKSQGTDHSQAEHKKADLDALLNKKIVQTITENDTTHVPSADAVYDALLTEATERASADTTLRQNITAEANGLKSAIENTTIWDIDQQSEVTFEGDVAGTWEIMERQIPTENNDGIFLCMDSSAPSSSSSAGLKGQFYMDANYLYLCIANNTWRRVALSTF